ncbi:MAG: DUF5107 domain-containing protein [bacterium]
MKLSYLSGAAAILIMAAGAAFAAPVTVTTAPMTFKLETAEHQGRGGGPGYYIKKGTIQLIDDTVDVVKLNNGLIEAWVCPAYGARLLRVIDLQTKVDYFKMNEVFTDHIAWQTGGVKPSFPFFEHGTQLRQPAGYRIVNNADGSVTVAMDMRFNQFTAKDDLQRYGRYSDESMNVFVTVKPGSALVTWRQRKENPSPLAHSDKIWDVTLFPQERVRVVIKTTMMDNGKEVMKETVDEAAMKASTQFIYPARWVVDHGPTVVHSSPHWSALDNWNVSHFALYTPYGFGGTYYPKENISRLRINDTGRDQGPGMKLYSAFWADFTELWGGQGIVFETPGELKPGYVPVEFSHRFFLAKGIGKVSYANDDVAVSVDGNQFAMLATREANAVVTDDTGAVVAKGAVGPHTILKGTFGKKLIVALDGARVLDQTFPLDLPVPTKQNVFPSADSTVPVEVRKEFQALLARKNAGTNPTYYEQEDFDANEGMVNRRDALPIGKKLTAGGDPVRALSIARTIYRLGDLENAARIAKLYPGPDADFILGLIAMEKGEAADFGKAGVESNYNRAMLCIQKDDPKGAITLLDALITAQPKAFYPRLMRAYLSKDVQGAQRIADENPASPEAQLVLELLGVAGAKVEMESLLKNNPEAAAQVVRFQDQISKGKWVPVPRFPL